jgi:hypothetical protein
MRKVPQSDKVKYELTLNGRSTRLTALTNACFHKELRGAGLRLVSA